MNPYLFTIVFLMMMGLLASSEVIRFSQATLEHKCYTDSRDEFAAAQEMSALSQLDALKEEINPTPNPRPNRISSPRISSAKRITPLRVNTARPPNNARLNIYSLLQPPHKDLPKEFSLYEVLARLMRNLYGEEPFFQEIPRIECLILDRLIDKSDAMASFTTPDELSTLNLEDDNLQKIFYYMLKGTKKAHSLLNYLTFDKEIKDRSQNCKINLLFADPHILNAIFSNQEIAEKILEGREPVWREILLQEGKRIERSKEEGKGRKYFTEQLEIVLRGALEGTGFDFDTYKKRVFDLTLGHSGNVIFLTDSETGNVTRTKFTHESNKIL